MTNAPIDNRLAMYALSLLNQAKADAQRAANPYTLKDVVIKLADVLEFALTGTITNVQPVVTGASPASAFEDPTRTRIELTAGPGAVAAAQAQAAGYPDPHAYALQQLAPAHAALPPGVPIPNAVAENPIPTAGPGGGQRVEFTSGPGAAAVAGLPPPAPEAANVAVVPPVAHAAPPVPPPLLPTRGSVTSPAPGVAARPSPTHSVEAGGNVQPAGAVMQPEAIIPEEIRAKLPPILEVTPTNNPSGTP